MENSKDIQLIGDDQESIENLVKNAPIKALRSRTINIISSLLNPTRILCHNGLRRDWQGLAELCGIPGDQILCGAECSDPTEKVLKLWPFIEKGCTVGKLLEFLEKLGRFDVIDDAKASIEEDVKFFNKNPPKEEDLDLEPEQTYDAFVLFSDEDIDFATKLIDHMERQYNFKLCAKDRDMPPGSTHGDLMNVINRCNRLIVIISPAFLESNSLRFYYDYVQGDSVENNKRKIIPCIYKQCETLPPILSCYFCLKYRTDNFGGNFWERLRDVIRPPTIKHSVNRSISEKHRKASKDCTQSIEQSRNHAKNLNHSVKFSSMVNLNSPDSEVLPEQNLNSSSSANHIGSTTSSQTESIKTKKSKNWITKILHKTHKHQNGINNTNTIHNTDSSNGIVVEKHKKKFWTLNSKRKAQVAH